MAPGGSGKRKRGDRSWSGDSGNDGQRPSPHRPGNLNMAQQSQGRDFSDNRGRGGRRPSRGNRNAAPTRRMSDGQNLQSQRRDASSPSKPAASPPENSTRDNAEPSRSNGIQPARSNPPSQNASNLKQNSAPTYDFEYLKPEYTEKWLSTGKEAIVKTGISVRNDEDPMKLALIFQEIIRSAFDSRISATEGGATIKEILGEQVAEDDVDMVDGIKTSENKFDPRSIFLDTLSILTDTDTSNPALRPLAYSTGIPPALMRHELETPLLQALGLIRDTFARMGIRKQTNLLYRQSNYNLLREESEGYSKLLTELFTTSSNEPPSSEVVEDTFEKVKAMIGAFDMDVGRVLDVTLDVFAAVLVKQYRFFVKFLRVSSWWPRDEGFRKLRGDTRDSGLPAWALPGSSGWVTTDEEREDAARRNEDRDKKFWQRVNEIGVRAFFEIGRCPVPDAERAKYLSEVKGKTQDEVAENRKWIEETGTLPPQGNRVAAQLLGFKLRFYSSPARNPSDVLPDNLIYLAALLIKVGFISFRDLYPHLWRPDDSMEALKEEKMAEKSEREKAALPGAGTMNALMAAGALSDDTLPGPPRPREPEARAATPAKDQETDKATAAKPEDKDALPEPADQKVLLLKSMLAIGAIPESLYILGRFPWLLDAYPELPEFIHRILHQCLSKIYASLGSPNSRGQQRDTKRMSDLEQTGVPKGQVRLVDAPSRRVLRWALLDKEDTNDGTDYRFYWDDWADNIPICQTVDDVFSLCNSLLNLLGVKIAQDPTLLSKLVRIGKHSLNVDSSDMNKKRWRDLSKRLLVPSLSLTKENPGVANELFELLNNFPREERYSIYSEWYTGQISRLPDIKSAFDQAKAETKDTLKRLSKTNIRPMARALAKIGYANPGIVVNVAISQIESYENLIEVVVECARYFTFLGYDVLTWSLVSSLGHKGRSRVQEGGLLTSRWLNALALFTGRAFKRYSVMNPIPVFQYVVEQLRHNNSTDLVVLEQMISSMAGIITDTSFNDAQIQAMAGGDLLQSQTMLQLLDKRHESKTTSKRLMKSLTDSKLAGQLLIAIGQERATCVFKELGEDAELKLIGNIFDEIHRVLTQYLDLLRSNFTIEEFDATVPELPRLICEFGIQPEVAFWISRPSISKQIEDLDKQMQEEPARNKEGGPTSASKSPDGDVEMGDEVETVERNKDSSEAAAAAENDDSIEANGESPIDRPDSAGPTPGWNPVLQNLMDGISSAMPSEVWETVGLPFYVTFWQLSLYDIHVPQKAYEDEIERQKKKVVTIGNDRSDVSVAGTQRKEREKKQIAELQDRILGENKQHLRAYGRTRSRLQKEKDRWFAGMRGKHDALNIAIMEQCLVPRILLSPVDAFYCFKLLKYLHTSGTSNFRTVGLLDQLFRGQRLSALIFLCSSKESDNLGCFLNEVLRDLSRWHADKTVYEKEAYGSKRDLQGFATALDPEGKPTTFLEYEDFRRLLYKWHRILGGSLKTCLTSGEYMHIRNAISVLKAIVQHFPAVNWIGADMHAVVENISKTADRKDIQTPAASLIGDLNRREKKWLLPQAFMIVSLPASKVQDGANPSKNESVPNDKSATGKSRPQSTSTTPNPMNATAPEFKPTAVSANVNGTQKPQAAGRTEVEDGEIEDAKMTDVNSKEEDNVPQQAETAEDETDTAQKQPEPAENGVSATADKDTDAQNEKNETPREEPPLKKEESESAPPQTSGPSRPPSEPVTEPQPDVPTRTSASPARSRTDQPPASQSPLPASGPRRTDIDRNQSSSISSIRPQPHLPNRPEPPRDFRRPDMRVPMRPPDIPDERWDARDSRHQDHSRYGRYDDQDRERALDHSSMDERSHGRLNERPPARGGDRDFPSRPSSDDHFQRPPFRDSHLPARDQEWPERAPRARQSQSDLFASRQHDQDRSTRNMAPPHKPPQHPERGGTRDGPADDDSARAPGQGGTDRDDRRTHPSRQQSPARIDDPRLPSRPDRRDDRFPSDDRRSGSFSQSHAPRHDDIPPSGPRGERSSRGGPADDRPPVDFSRDSRGGQPPSQDPNHGRLNQGSRYPPAAHDSLNDRPPPDIPLGPRGGNKGGRGSRPGSISQGPPPNNPPSQLPERQPPTGPSSRSGTRGTPRQEQPPASSNSRPPTPASENIDTAGIHPDRLKALGLDKPPARAPSPPAPILPPSGPRGAPSGPSGPSPTTRGPPTGPTFAGERGRGDKRFAGLNNMLQQSSGTSSDRSGQGTTIRGRGANRQSGASMNAPSPQSMGPPTPVGPHSESQGASADAGSGRERPDLFAGRKNEPEDESSTPTRSGGGRRTELIDSSSEPRRSSRNASSGTHTPDRERERERDRTRTRDRDRDREGSRRGEEENARAPGRRDQDRDRRASENATSTREDVPGSREPSRRTGGSGRDEGQSTRRRERRGRDDGVNSSSLGGEYGNVDRAKPPPPPPPPPPPAQNDGRRWGAGGGAGGRNEERERDRDHGRGRDRNRDRREENAGGTLPRKRGRPPAGDDGPRGGGMRVGSDHKRPRR